MSFVICHFQRSLDYILRTSERKKMNEGRKGEYVCVCVSEQEVDIEVDRDLDLKLEL